MTFHHICVRMLAGAGLVALSAGSASAHMTAFDPGTPVAQIDSATVTLPGGQQVDAIDQNQCEAQAQGDETCDGATGLYVRTSGPLAAGTRLVFVVVSGGEAYNGTATIGAGGILVGSLADGTAAPASAPQHTGVESITVTSQKKAEDIQSVPIAVSALTGQRMVELGAVTIEALRGYIPNVQIQQFSNTPHGSVFNIRGMGVIEPDPYAGTTVVVVQDQVPQFFNMTALLDIYDLERIEVLRGAQGTLFGANSTGGVIQAVNKAPVMDEYGGDIFVGYGNYDRIDLRGAINIPLVENVFAARLAVSHFQRDGYLTNIVDGKDAGDKDRTSFRLSLKYEGEKIDATLIGEYSMHRDGSPASINGALPEYVVDTPDGASPAEGLWYNPTLGCYAGDPCTPGQTYGEALFIPEGTVFDPSVAVMPMYRSPCAVAGERCKAPKDYYTARGNDSPNLSDLDAYSLTFILNWDSPIGQITSITGYKDFRLREFTDQDFTPLHLDSTDRKTEGWQFTQELRDTFQPFEGMETMIGVFYAQYNWNHYQDFRIQFASPGFRQLTRNFWETKTASFFMHSYLEITDRFRLQGGVRFNYEKTKADTRLLNFFDLNGEAQYQGPGANETPSATELGPDLIGETLANGKESWSEWAGKFGFEYDLTEDALAYGYYAHGFKSGGFTGRIGIPQDLGPYNPEYVDSIELGAKTQWFDNRLRFNLALFYNWYQDIQLAQIFFSEDQFGNRINGNTILNAAGAHTKGVEVEIIAVPTDWLMLNGAIGYLDATYSNFIALDSFGNEQDLSGNVLQNAPEWTINAGFQINLPIGNWLEMMINMQYKYVSKKYNTSLFNTARAEIQPTHIVDLNIDFSNPDGDWTLGFYARNLFDNRYIDSVFDAPATFALVNYQDPRTYGVTLKANF